MTPEQRARKYSLIESMRASNIEHVRFTLDEAQYLLDAANLPDLEKRLEAAQAVVLNDAESFQTLYERESIRAEKAVERCRQLQAEIAELREAKQVLLEVPVETPAPEPEPITEPEMDYKALWEDAVATALAAEERAAQAHAELVTLQIQLTAPPEIRKE